MTSKPTTASEFRSHWPVVAASAAGIAFGIAMIGPLFSFMVEEFETIFGWSRTSTSAAMLVMAASAFTLPAIGLLLDRFGGLSVAIPGLLGFAAGFVLLSSITENIMTFYGAFLFLTVFGAAAGPIVYSRAITRYFDRARGLALALTLSGSTLIAIIGPPIAGRVIEAQGIFTLFQILAGVTLVLGLPCAYFALRKRDIAVGTNAAAASIDKSATKAARQLAFRDRRFYLLCTAIFLMAIPVVGLSSQIKPLATGRGFSATDGALLVSLLGASMAVGRLLTGTLIDRFWAPGVAAFIAAFACIGCVMVALGGSSLFMIGFGLFFIAVAQGAELDLIAYLTSRYFGPEAYGALYGIVYLSFSLAIPVGAISFAVSHDVTSTYIPALYAGAIVFLLAAGAFWLLGRYPDEATLSHAS